MWKTFTMSRAGLVTCIAVTVVGIIDLWFVLITGTGTSISNFLVNTGYASPFVVFTFGYLAGHLFSSMTPTKPE